jgi:HEAT repeat protein
MLCHPNARSDDEVSRHIAALKSKDQITQQQAAMALGESRDERAVAPLVSVLSNRNPYLRNRAAEALGKIGAPAVEPLLTALKDAKVRANAALALGDIGDKRAVEPMLALLQDSNDYVRQQAAGVALAKIQAARAAEPQVTAPPSSR